MKQEAHQLVGLGKMQQHSTLQSRQTFSQIQLSHYWWSCVKLWPNYAPACRRRRHFRPFFLTSITAKPEVASDVIYGVVVDTTSMDVRIKFGARDIRLLHLVTGDERRRRLSRIRPKLALSPIICASDSSYSIYVRYIN